MKKIVIGYANEKWYGYCFRWHKAPVKGKTTRYLSLSSITERPLAIRKGDKRGRHMNVKVKLTIEDING